MKGAFVTAFLASLVYTKYVAGQANVADSALLIMDGFDTNKDGKISLRELLDHVPDSPEAKAAFGGWQAGFLQADTNKDGHLHVGELATLLNKVGEPNQKTLIQESEVSVADSIMDGFDTDKDGKLSLMELLEHVSENPEATAAFQGWQAGFKQADVDQDLHLTVKELASLLTHVDRQEQHKLVEDSETSVARSIMDGLDLNKDSRLSLNEFVAHVKDNPEVTAAFGGWQTGFVDADADKDHHLTVEELAALLKRVSRSQQHKLVEESEVSVAASIMDGFDSNKDGSISLKELLDHVGEDSEVHAAFKGWQEGFLSADADKNGRLSIQELASLLAHVSRQDQHKLVEESEVSVAASIMDGFDTNKDGKISLRELLDHAGPDSDPSSDHQAHEAFEGWQSGFLQADADKDGHLSIEELASLLKQISRTDQHKLVEESEVSVALSIMDGFDTNKDAKISLKELMDHVGGNPEVSEAFGGWQAGFLDADTDKDGHLTVHELATLLNHVSRKDQHKLVEDSEVSVAGSIMDGFDTNKDGAITLKELLDHVSGDEEVQAAFQGWQEGFLQADADRDGRLTVQELGSLLNHVSRPDQRKMVEDSEMSVAESIMDGFDSNKDSLISMQELLDHVSKNKEVQTSFGGWQAGFLEADHDGDGHLNVEELASLLLHVSRQDQHNLVEESEASMAASIVSGFDTNNDGKISLKELLAHTGDSAEVNAAFGGWKAGFLDADADKDGHLNVQELASLLNHVSRQDQHKLVEESAVVSSLLDGYDADKDGKISLMELLNTAGIKAAAHEDFEGWQTGFKNADADGDELLDGDELETLLKHVNHLQKPIHDEM